MNEITGDDPHKAIREKMKYLFTDPVQEGYTWCGTSQKQPFKDLTYVNRVILLSVKDQFKDFRGFQYKNYQMQWLKNAKSRQREVTYVYPDRRQFGENFEDEEIGF